MSAAVVPTHPELARWMRLAAVAGVVGVGVSLALALADRDGFFRAWLVAYTLVLGLALGGMFVVMLNYLVGGDWGFVTRRFLEASTRTLPLVTLLFVPLLVPVLLGWAEPYQWANAEVVKHDHLVAKKAPYLRADFFALRAAIYFAIWNVLAYLLNAWSKKQDTARSPALADRCATLSAPGIVLYVLTITFASIDWVMSLEPHWYSSIYMAIFGMSQILTAFAFAVAMLLLVGPKPSGDPHKPFALASQTLADLGSLMLAFTMVWAYLSLCQFLLIWSGNLPIEIAYYARRGVGYVDGQDATNVWTFVGVGLIALGFFAPFLLLLNPSIKRDRRRVAAVALWVVFMRVVDTFWVIVPAFDREGKGGSLLGLLLYPAALVGVGGVWMAFYLWQLQRVPLMPQYNPAEAAHGQAH